MAQKRNCGPFRAGALQETAPAYTGRRADSKILQIFIRRRNPNEEISFTMLALVMTMSLVTIGAGLTDSEITYKEAVDVISALVFDSYSDGDFVPMMS